jgi:hypothetical protein
VPQAGLIAPLPHLAADVFRREWLAQVSYQKSEVTARARVDDAL